MGPFFGLERPSEIIFEERAAKRKFSGSIRLGKFSGVVPGVRAGHKSLVLTADGSDTTILAKITAAECHQPGSQRFVRRGRRTITPEDGCAPRILTATAQV